MDFICNSCFICTGDVVSCINPAYNLHNYGVSGYATFGSWYAGGFWWLHDGDILDKQKDYPA